MKRIYIAHPYTGSTKDRNWGDKDRNLNRYLRIVARATEQGHVVLTWLHHHFTHDAGLTCIDGQDPHDYYLERDEALIAVADELWASCPPGVSRGVDREVAFARDKGIPVVRQPYMERWDWPPGAGERNLQITPCGLVDAARDALLICDDIQERHTRESLSPQVAAGMVAAPIAEVLLGETLKNTRN